LDNVGVILAALERAPALVEPLVREVSQVVLKRRPKPGKWSAHEHACHLAVIHPVLSARLDLMLTDPQPRIASYFPSADEEDGALLNVDLGESMERFSIDRRRLVERLRTLSADDWQRTARHDEYTHYSVFYHVPAPCAARHVPRLSHRRIAFEKRLGTTDTHG
jgi:DinB superfamily